MPIHRIDDVEAGQGLGLCTYLYFSKTALNHLTANPCNLLGFQFQKDRANSMATSKPSHLAPLFSKLGICQKQCYLGKYTILQRPSVEDCCSSIVFVTSDMLAWTREKVHNRLDVCRAHIILFGVINSKHQNKLYRMKPFLICNHVCCSLRNTWNLGVLL